MPRLPQPGGDAGNWGEILNEYLSVEHAIDGSLKPGGSLASKVNAADLADVATTGNYNDLENIPSTFTPAPHNHDGVYVRPADLGTAATENTEHFAPAVHAKGVVMHGGDANTPRPHGYASIEWIGTVEPVNMANGDTWVVLP